MGNRRAESKITVQDLKMLQPNARSHTEAASRVQRAKILLLCDNGERIEDKMNDGLMYTRM